MTNILWAILFAALPPCQFEDSHNCAWDAHTQGNSQGTSLIDMGGRRTWADF